MSISIVSILVAVGFLAFCIFKIWQMVQFFQRRSASETWPVTTGEIISRNVNVQHSSRSGNSYYPEIKYKYTVMGQEFEKKITLGGIYSRKSAEDAINNLGNTIEVRYNPDNPQEQISEKEKFNFVDVLLIVVTLAVAVFVLYPLVLKNFF
jgi:hypothetical protein